MNTPANELFGQLVTNQHIDTTVPFPGVNLIDIPLLETLYQLRIEVFDFLEKEEALIPKLRSGNTTYTDTMHLFIIKTTSAI